MSAVPKTRLTPETYLAIERKAAFRSEYFDGEMFAMAGASEPHNRIVQNLNIEVGSRLKNSGCHSYSNDMRVKVTRTGLYTYPDIIIVCGKSDLEDALLDTLLNPQVIIEVLSPSTEGYDRGKKFRHYKQIESFRDYVLVSQEEPAITSHVRQLDGQWTHTDVEGLDKELVFRMAPVRVPMAEVYAGVTFPEGA